MPLAFFRKLLPRAKSSSRRLRRPLCRFVPRLEALEDRMAPAILNVPGGFATIQAAVNAASPGDTIVVAPGTYNELVTVNVPNLTIDGAQAGVNGNSGSRVAGGPSESTLDNADGGFEVKADNVIINGFTIEDNTSGANIGAGIQLDTGFSGAQIINNIITNNIIGLKLASDGLNQTIVRFNKFDSNNNPGASGGIAIYTDQFVAGGTLSNVLIDSNSFLNQNQTSVFFGSTNAADIATNITVSNNDFEADVAAVTFTNTTNSSIIYNTVNGSTGNPATTADILILEGSNLINITNNLLENGNDIPLWLSNEGNPAPDSPNDPVNVAFSGNSMSGYSVAAAPWVFVQNYNGTLDARANWWGTTATSDNAGNNIPNLAGTGDDFSNFLTTGANLLPAGRVGFQGAFFVEPTLPGTTTPPGPTIETTQPTFYWAPGGGTIAGYQMWLKDLNTGVVSIFGVGTGTNYALTVAQGLTPGHQYQWAMANFAPNGFVNWNHVTTLNFTVDATLATPTPSSPGFSGAPQVISTDLPTFSWTLSAGATSAYEISLKDQTTGQVSMIPAGTGTSYVLTASQAITPGDTFQWTVGSVTSNGQVINFNNNLLLNFMVTGIATSTPSGPGFPVGPGPTLTTTAPTFSWTVGAGTTPGSFMIWLKDLTTNQQPLIFSAGTGTSYTLTAAQTLKLGDMYQWASGAVSTNGKVINWNNVTYGFFVAPGAVNLPTAMSPGNLFSSPTIDSDVPTFSWTKGAGADAAYDIWVKDTTSGKVTILDGGTGTSFAWPANQALMPGDNFQWTVGAASNQNQVINWNQGNILNFTVATLAMPTPVSPTGPAQINSDQPTFSWTAGAGTTPASYDIWLKDMSTGTVTILSSPGSGTTFVLPPAQAVIPGDTYEWTVGGVSTNGQVISYNQTNILTFIAAPVPTSPGSTVPPGPPAGSTQPTFTWNTMFGALSYDIWLKNVTTGQVQILQVGSGSTYTLTPAQALPAGDHFQWTVGALIGNGQVGWNNATILNFTD